MDYAERQEKLYAALSRGGDIKKQIQGLFAAETLSFVGFVDRYIEDHGLKRQFIINKAQLSPQYGYKLLSGQKHTKDRNVIIRLCMAMGMSLDETQQALRSYGMPPLDHNLCRDGIIIAGVTHGHDIYTVQGWLESIGEVPLIN